MAATIICKTNTPEPTQGLLTDYFSIQGADVRDMFKAIHHNELEAYLHLVCRDGTRMIAQLDNTKIHVKRDITMQCTRLVRRYDAAIKWWICVRKNTPIESVKIRLEYLPE